MAESHLFRGGRIFTGRRQAEALLVEEGQVSAVGTQRAVSRVSPTGVERHDLSGGVVIPGLIDAHMHLLGTVVRRSGVDLRGSRTAAEILERCRDWASRNPRGPILGGGWDQELLPGREFPAVAPFDRAFPERPVALSRICGHVALLNERAQDAIRSSKTGRMPPVRPPGRPAIRPSDGLLFEGELRPLRVLEVDRFLHAREEFHSTLAEASSFGLTTVCPMSVEPEELEFASRESARGPLPVRLRCYLDIERFHPRSRLPGPTSGQEVCVQGVKGYLDGSFGARTAWLEEPYSDDPATSGQAAPDPDRLAGNLLEASDSGLQVALHAIGDRAIALGLELFERLGTLREPRLEHASLVPPRLYPRLDRIRPHLVVQPRFVQSDTWLEDRLGPVRTRSAYTFRTFLDRGYSVAGSSDAPVESLDPWTGIQAAVERDGRPTPSRQRGNERLSPGDALSLYTSRAGAVVGDPRLGNLEPGAEADFVCLTAPTLETAIRRGSAAVRETWKGGVRTYRARKGRGTGRSPRQEAKPRRPSGGR